jgi:NTP pyrophosphatase (non-canonical NTP hydrolase)
MQATKANKGMNVTLKELTGLVTRFREARDWRQFHTPKDLAMDLCVEAAEVAEHTLWRRGRDLDRHLDRKKSEIADELADVLHVILLLADELKIDLGEAMHVKMEKNERKYPVHKSRGKATKYTEL